MIGDEQDTVITNSAEECCQACVVGQIWHECTCAYQGLFCRALLPRRLVSAGLFGPNDLFS